MTENSLMILVLDDDRGRLVDFERQWGHHIVTCVTTAAQAIMMLEHFVFDLVFLDHDLGGQVFVSHAEINTGAAVARWLEDPDNYRSVPKAIVIHSLNPSGAKYMAQALPYAMVCPDGAWCYPPDALPSHLIPASLYAR